MFELSLLIITCHFSSLCLPISLLFPRSICSHRTVNRISRSRKICFFYLSCAKSNLKKVSLELGGKSPLVIFKDCDLDKAVRSGCGAVFFNKGENCIAAGRLFVEESIHDEFLRRVVSFLSACFFFFTLIFTFFLLLHLFLYFFSLVWKL